MKLINKRVANGAAIGISTATAMAVILSQHRPTTIDVFERLAPSVVEVRAYNLRRDVFSPSRFVKTHTSSGSGFVFDQMGHILTNNHVIENAVDIDITYGGTTEEATVIGKDEKRDIAILSLKRNKLYPHLDFCDTSPKVGTQVIAVGNPFGFNQSLSTGVVSGLGRTLDGDRPLVNMIQTDAAINPGNSGGPLLDKEQECVIGMNTAMISPGVGFAIPTEDLKESIEIIFGTKVQNDILGVEIMPDELTDAFGLPGIAIVNVIEGSIADKLDLQGTSRDEFGRPLFGDIILEVNGVPTKHIKDLKQALSYKSQMEIKVLKETEIVMLFS